MPIIENPKSGMRIPQDLMPSEEMLPLDTLVELFQVNPQAALQICQAHFNQRRSRQEFSATTIEEVKEVLQSPYLSYLKLPPKLRRAS